MACFCFFVRVICVWDFFLVPSLDSPASRAAATVDGNLVLVRRVCDRTPVGPSGSTVRDTHPARCHIPPGFPEARTSACLPCEALFCVLVIRPGVRSRAGGRPQESRSSVGRGRSWRGRGAVAGRVLEPPGREQPPRLSPRVGTWCQGLPGRPQGHAQDPGLKRTQTVGSSARAA